MPCFQAIEKKYDISGIPTLIVVRKSDGGIITMEGVEAIEEKGNQVFTTYLLSYILMLMLLLLVEYLK